MKYKKYISNLKTKSLYELQNELIILKKKLFNLKFYNKINKLKNINKIKNIRKNISRIKILYYNKLNIKKGK